MNSIPFSEFLKQCRSLAEQLKKESKLTIVGHHDADGLASTAITVKALRREGIDTDYMNTRQLDNDRIDQLNSVDNPLVFVDFGSGQIETIEKEIGNKFYIIDHHPPVKDTSNQVNPCFYDIDGARELSAAGTCYFVARELNKKNKDLSAIAIVGSVGDMQDLDGGLKGANREIVKDAQELGLVDAHRNLLLFGKHSRSIARMLEYCSDPLLPGLTGNYHNCVQFIGDLGIELKNPITGEDKFYVDLTSEEKQKFTSGLYTLLLEYHPPDRVSDLLIGEVYELLKEPERTELRDAREFATVLNACGRNDEGNIGVEVCMGDRKAAWKRAQSLLEMHRKQLREGLEWVKENGLQQMDNIYYFDATGVIKDTIVGVIAGMVYGGVMRGTFKPILGMTEVEDGWMKASSRGTNALVRKGLKLGTVMREACAMVGGEGGGHDVAAGAKFPIDRKEEFIEICDRMVGEQMGTQKPK